MLGRQAAEVDPLLGAAPPPFKKIRSPLLRHDDVACMMFLPWLCFVACAIAEGLISPDNIMISAWLVLISFLLAIMCLLLAIFRSRVRDRRGSWGMLFTAVLCMTAVMAGWSVGHIVRDFYMNDWWRLQHGSTYTGVSASNGHLNASVNASYRAASVLVFNEGSFIDTERTVGYMRRGKVYCVAPISSESYHTDPLYYAIGMDCCDQRSDFRCDDHGVAGATTGLVATTGLEHYRTAIRMAQAVYGLKRDTPSPRILVHWSKSATAYEAELKNKAIYAIVMASGVHLMLSGTVAIFLRSVLKA